MVKIGKVYSEHIEVQLPRTIPKVVYGEVDYKPGKTFGGQANVVKLKAVSGFHTIITSLN